MLPISSEEGNLSYLDALFEATSAVCVTAFLDSAWRLGYSYLFHLIHFYAKANSVGDNSWYDKGLYSIVG